MAYFRHFMRISQSFFFLNRSTFQWKWNKLNTKTQYQQLQTELEYLTNLHLQEFFSDLNINTLSFLCAFCNGSEGENEQSIVFRGHNVERAWCVQTCCRLNFKTQKSFHVIAATWHTPFGNRTVLCVSSHFPTHWIQWKSLCTEFFFNYRALFSKMHDAVLVRHSERRHLNFASKQFLCGIGMPQFANNKKSRNRFTWTLFWKDTHNLRRVESTLWM